MKGIRTLPNFEAMNSNPKSRIANELDELKANTKLEQALGISLPTNLESSVKLVGINGVSVLLEDSKMLRLVTEESEAEIASRFKGKRYRGLPFYFGSWRLKNKGQKIPDFWFDVFFIVCERFKANESLARNVLNLIESVSEKIEPGSEPFVYSTWTRDFYQGFVEACEGVSNTNLTNYAIDLANGLYLLSKNDIKYYDLHTRQIAFLPNKSLALIDVGHSEGGTIEVFEHTQYP